MRPRYTPPERHSTGARTIGRLRRGADDGRRNRLVRRRADAPVLLAACPRRNARERRAPNRPLGRRRLPDLRQRRRRGHRGVRRRQHDERRRLLGHLPAREHLGHLRRHPDRQRDRDQGGARRLGPCAPDLRDRAAARSEPALRRRAARAHPPDQERPPAGDRVPPALKDPMAASDRKVRFKATRDVAIDPSRAGDPRALGATLEFAGESPGDGMTGPITLDPMLWTGLGRPAGSRGYKYFDRSRSNGVKKIAFRSGPRGGALTVSGGGSAWPYQIAQAQGPIDVRFTLDSDVYCARFVSFRRNQAGRVSATDASAPPDCADPPPPTCGDGVVEGTEECD